MELTVALLLSIISCGMGVFNTFMGRKDKSNKDVGNDQYNQGRLDATLKNITEKLDRIENKLTNYDKEIDTIVEKRIQLHEAMYHKN